MELNVGELWYHRNFEIEITEIIDDQHFRFNKFKNYNGGAVVEFGLTTSLSNFKHYVMKKREKNDWAMLCIQTCFTKGIRRIRD